MTPSSVQPAADWPEPTPIFDIFAGLDWGTSVVLHPGNIVTFNFLEEGTSVVIDGFDEEDDEELDELDDDDDGEVGFIVGSWSDFEKQRVLSAFDVISNVIDVRFAEVDTPEDAVFRLGTNGEVDLGGTLGLFMAPEYSNQPGLGLFNQQGQGWDAEGAGSGLFPGGYGFTTLIHEIGHGLGVAHPHDGGGTSAVFPSPADLPEGFVQFDQGVYTVMSYNDGWVTGPDGVSPSNDFGWAAGLMALDIYVLQRKYGANTTHAAEDSVYVLSDTNEPGTGYQAIWDTGGFDIIRYEGERDVKIDLNAATLLYEEGGGGVVSYAAGVYGGYTIAYGVVIEGAESGAGNDILIGNAYDNHFRPGAGNDEIDGGAGHDTVFLESFSDQVVIGRVGEVLTVQAADGEKSLLNIERVVFTDQTLAFDVEGVIGQTELTYWAAFGRSSDAAGLGYWVEQQEAGSGFEGLALAATFIASQEYAALFADETNNGFVTRLYDGFLQREADVEGQDFWEGALGDGVSRAEVMASFVASEEAQQYLQPLMETGLWLA